MEDAEEIPGRPKYGTMFIHPNPDVAAKFAEAACSLPPTDDEVYLNLFCDASQDINDPARGGISVTFPHRVSDSGRSPRDLISAAWPVNPIYDNRLGELLALAQCLVVATDQIVEFREAPTVAGKTIVVRIFNDNMHNLQFICGWRQLDDDFVTLAWPVIKLIRLAIQNLLSTPVVLEMHWIPGHNHRVEAHRIVVAREMLFGCRSR
ncbi:hypothetical protein C8A01DRAFT_50552 [Parachaetomium inaequale]|uniref:Uncharacterized protein n=1 Tax=Parachaetomium inaequale TaxID=2588326 RepID=A0AAN6P6S5_9PEZI|nr:hypothetical protein C8A01DRAFT_50552 [Parachaetomium inaequale]